MRTPPALLFLLSALAVAGPAAPEPAKPRTLRTETKIPATDIEKFYNAEIWKQIADQPITAFAVLHAMVDAKNGTVALKKQFYSYPDESWGWRARDLARLKVGKFNLIPNLQNPVYFATSLEIYVIFYESTPTDGMALIYAKSEDGSRSYQIVDHYHSKLPIRKP